MDSTSVQTLTQFYDAAFNHLITYTALLIGVVGVIVPIVIAFIQNRSVAREIKDAEQRIATSTANVSAVLEETIDDRIALGIESYKTAVELKFTEVETKLNKKIICTEAATYHLQANSFSNQDLHGISCADYVKAASLYLAGDDEQNGRVTLHMLVVTLDEVLRSEVEEHDIKDMVEGLFKELEEKNVNGRYTRIIADLKAALKGASVRTSRNN